ncbi:MAG: valine--tRNA ligase [Thermodesulfovibrionales bacterium]
MNMSDFRNAYDPEGIEERWYQEWIDRSYFNPDRSDGKPYSIVIPPPNVTGSLHMGHALNATLQDILIRWKRMLGFKTLWLPGTDHAGIATQNVVERELAREGTDRHALGREAFIERVWKWKAEYGGRIINQLKRLGASCDWSRERFTLDEGLSRAVREVFVRLYEEGLIYRDNRLINWCPRCRTALSDLEVEHEEIEGILTYIRYPFSDGSGYIVVATTRPETMLGDTAVAVNPEDDRYKKYIGLTIALPLTDRHIPIISDSAVDPSFGTGAVKVTPAHDFNDEAIARRQTPVLPFITVIGEDGRMTAQAGNRYYGLERYECRKAVVSELKELGLIEKEERHRHSVGHCYRCKTIIEPFLTPQWYVKVKPLAEEAIRAVREGRVRIIPDMWANTYFSWMENIRDWCISRQIWWGHRIPVWYCQEKGNSICEQRKGIIVSRETPKECPYCGSVDLTQDEDVLDTWFSSALWPFSTLGWPDDTADLRTFYPTSVLVTAFDILFFWVARMIMMGLKFMKEVPFRDVYIHALVRDSKGEKMSKSKGNVIDPLIMINKYGADAFRFSLAAFAAQGRDIRFSEDRVEGYRHFINKLWNATRFILINIDNLIENGKSLTLISPLTEGKGPMSIPERWILSRLAATTDEINSSLENYRFNEAANSIYQFIWHEFCDWYIEISKVRLKPTDGESIQKAHDEKEQSYYESLSLSTLLLVLERSLRLLHPFMPFVTEEIWQNTRNYLLGRGIREEGLFGVGVGVYESLVVSPYPVDLNRDDEAEKEMSYIIEAVTSIRNIRGELNISPNADIIVLIRPSSDYIEEVIKSNMSVVGRLVRASEVQIGKDLRRPEHSAITVSPNFEIYIPVKGLINIEEEINRLSKEKNKIEESLSFLSKKLMNDEFLSRAPRLVVEKERGRYQELILKKEGIEKGIERLKEWR